MPLSYVADGEVARVREELLARRGEAGKRKAPERAKPNSADRGVSVDDFHAYMPMHSYIFEPTREMWPGASVNAPFHQSLFSEATENPRSTKAASKRTCAPPPGSTKTGQSSR